MTILDELGAGFCSYALMMLIQSSLLIAVLLAIDLLLRRRVRAVVRYCIWMLVFVKLVLPPTLCLPTGAGYWLGDYLSADLGVLEQRDSACSESGKMSVTASVVSDDSHAVPSHESGYEPAILGASDSASTGMSTQAVIFSIWVFGVLLLSALLVQRIWFVRGLVAQSDPVKGGLADKLNDCRRQVGIRFNVELRVSPTALSPATCGLLRPKILLPASMLARLSADKLRTVLIHELAHIKRGDLWVNFAQNVLQVVYFYNPLLWLANAVVCRIREQAVDEMVLASLGDQAKSYSKTLVDIAEMAFLRPSLGLRLIGVVESRKALAGRIRHITTRPFPKTARLGIRGVVAVLIVAAVLLPMARGHNKGAEEPMYPDDWAEIAATDQPDEPVRPPRRSSLYAFERLRNKPLVSMLLEDEFQGQLDVTYAEIREIMESDPTLDYQWAKAILEGESRRLVDEFYQQLCTEWKVKKLRENLQTVVNAHQRLLFNPQEPRSVYWIMNRQMKQELTQQEKDTLLATYEGGQVILEDWFEMLNEIPPLKRPKDLGTVEGVERLLDEAIRTSIFLVEAESRGLEADENTKLSATKPLHDRLVTRVYDVSGLVGARDNEVEDRAERVQQLMNLIVDTIEPDSWYGAGTGDGTITSYADKNLIILQTPAVHNKIDKVLNEMRRAIPPQITVEGRFLSVSDEFLKSMGADGNSLCDIRSSRHRFNSVAETRTKPFAIEFEGEDANAPVPESGNPTIPEAYSCLLDDLQVHFLLGAVQADKDSKVLTAPRVTMLAGESAEVKIETEHRYISGYVEPNSPSDQPEPKIEYIKTGTTLEVLAKLTDDGANIKLDIEFEILDLIGFEERLYKGQYAYQVPTMEVLSSSTTVVMPNGATVLIGGKKLTAENDDGRKVEKNLLVLIKAKKSQTQFDQNHTLAESAETISP
jgi:beta-lactamase regulating signal transducer with metallopeptidase domain